MEASASTVRNRIEKLEDADVLEGYHPKLNYEEANLPLQLLCVCTADPTERSQKAQEALEIPGVIEVREMVTGHRNLYIEVIGTSTHDISRITDAIHALGLAIESSEIMRQRIVQPFDHFSSNSSDEQERPQSE